jgi:N-methylhydantoinase A/oxoprolinase/acetone carboxylase beta subunit
MRIRRLIYHIVVIKKDNFNGIYVAAAGSEIVGPAVIEEPNSTTLIGSGDRAVVNASRHLIITLAQQA